MYFAALYFSCTPTTHMHFSLLIQQQPQTQMNNYTLRTAMQMVCACVAWCGMCGACVWVCVWGRVVRVWCVCGVCGAVCVCVCVCECVWWGVWVGCVWCEWCVCVCVCACVWCVHVIFIYMHMYVCYYAG